MGMSIIRFLLAIFCLSFSNAHAALDPLQIESWCGKFFKGGPWHVSQDPQTEASAKEFLAKANIRATPVVCSGAPSVPITVASQAPSSGFEKYFFIGINSGLRLSIGDELRGIVAHEVAHLVTNGDVNCKDKGSEERYELCEHAADKKADSWAGRGVVAHSLTWTIGYIEREYGSNSDASKKAIYSLRRRIFLLR